MVETAARSILLKMLCLEERFAKTHELPWVATVAASYGLLERSQ
jgi:hypothetical protein